MGLEVVVRPVVFPNIRPTSARSLPPVDDPTQGFAEIRGNGAKHIDLSNSYSGSTSTGKQKETKRQVDVARVYQQKDDGTINRENFVDIQVANKIWKKGGYGPAVQQMSAEEKQQRARDARAYDAWVEYYKRVEERKNIEIRERNKIIENDGQGFAQGIGA